MRCLGCLHVHVLCEGGARPTPPRRADRSGCAQSDTARGFIDVAPRGPELRRFWENPSLLTGALRIREPVPQHGLIAALAADAALQLAQSEC